MEIKKQNIDDNTLSNQMIGSPLFLGVINDRTKSVTEYWNTSEKVSNVFCDLTLIYSPQGPFSSC